MTVASISSQYLGTAMIPAITQSQSQFTRLRSSRRRVSTPISAATRSSIRVRAVITRPDRAASEPHQRQITLSRQIFPRPECAGLAADQRTEHASKLDDLEFGRGIRMRRCKHWALVPCSNSSASPIGLGDQYVFGGVNTGTPPLAAYSATPPSSAKSAIDSAFQFAFGFAYGCAAVDDFGLGHSELSHRAVRR